jgi:hypothetical protein
MTAWTRAGSLAAAVAGARELQTEEASGRDLLN